MKRIGQFIGISLVQAAVAGAIVWLWGLLMTNMEKLADISANNGAYGFLIVPIIFMIVAVLSAGAVLGYPIYLVFNNQWGRAIGLIILTLVWLGLLSAIMIYIF
ncbi:MAG: hypothetical protein PHR51_00245 [Patescibacteria group bacterium]|nr:hypothetical protein [Patescibacteria group bacterium]